ncbi:N-acyl homoserine lactonase family protein [Polyangium aurulentum]|nr:N-acyl homoserine lactonase family protein [Polyangium aurulentum]
MAALFLVTLPACGSGAKAPAAASTPEAIPPAPPEVRLHAFACGYAEIEDMALFGDESGPRELVAPCYLIRHPRGTLLWDTGVDDTFAQTKGGVLDPRTRIRFRVETPLRDQLRALHLAPADVTYVAFSHVHGDHAGNAALFPASTWILSRRELEWASTTPPPESVAPGFLSTYPRVKMRLLDGDADIFGDGTVKIVATPGHTPGHQSLVVKLRRAGTLVISGDACHTHGNWQHRRTPPFNTDREESVRSMERLKGLVDASHARFVVQHEPDELDAFPRFPGFLD